MLFVLNACSLWGTIMRLLVLLAALWLLSWPFPKELLVGAVDAAERPRAPLQEKGLFSVTATVALEPITGPPEAVSARMVHLLDAVCQHERLALLNYDEAKADYRLQGDLQAMKEENSIKVAYSWLIFDQTGEFIGSTSGTKIVTGTGAEPWSEVPEATLQAIAEEGIAAVVREARQSKPPMPQSR
jgi:hypothetical protein